MKRTADEPQAEDTRQREKKKFTEKNLCTPLCSETGCAYQGRHNQLILSLVNLQESLSTSLDEWKAYISGAKGECDFNKPILDEDPNCLHYPLLHWAAILGKVKAVTWLLQQDFIEVSKNPADVLSSLPNVANEMMLFSAVRWLHEGVKHTDPGSISNVFAKLLDPFLEHYPDLMLLKEDRNNDAVLHMCARAEDVPIKVFFYYLKRILRKLQEC